MRSTRHNAASLHGHGCQGGCGGRLHGIYGSVVDDDNENHRICRECVAKAGKRKAPAADSAGKAQSKRPKATNGGGVRSNGCLIFCGALPVVLVFFFFLQHQSGCARQTGDNLSRCSEGGGYSCSCSVFYCCLWCAFWSYFFSSFSFCNIEVGNEEWELSLHERVLFEQFVPSQLTRVHDVLVCITFAVD